MAKLKLYSREKILLLPIKKSPKGFRYAVTNYGRMISYLSTPEQGRFLKLGKTSGYPVITLRSNKGVQTYVIHRLMAKYLLKQPSPKHKFVIHLNYKKEDNYIDNLKWATREEQNKHIVKNRIDKDVSNYKLTRERVKMIKRKLLDGKRSLKMIAKQFGVSDMQIHRIKTGENWGHVKI